MRLGSTIELNHLDAENKFNLKQALNIRPRHCFFVVQADWKSSREKLLDMPYQRRSSREIENLVLQNTGRAV